MQQELKDKIIKAFDLKVEDYASAGSNVITLKEVLNEIKESPTQQGVEIDIVEIVKIVVEHLENGEAKGINKSEYILVGGMVVKNKLLDYLLDRKDRFIKGTIVKEDVK
jgi:hypothetical protein